MFSLQKKNDNSCLVFTTFGYANYYFWVLHYSDDERSAFEGKNDPFSVSLCLGNHQPTLAKKSDCKDVTKGR